MSNKDKIIEKVKLYSYKLKGFEGYTDLMGNEAFSRLSKMIEEFKGNAELALDENRLMRIGIIGQIKRGKSSFLNALFFEGEDVLPKAATPMTAALTKINYSENPQAEVEFYTQKEWQNIKTKADEAKKIAKANEELRNQPKNPKKKYRKPQEISTDQKSCLELVNMTKENGIGVDKYLGKIQQITDSASTQELIKELGNYVGSHGKYTPIVKSTTLSLNIGSLKDIEIVDTPGMNDPILSRAMRTEEYIGQCDVVFLLSYCSQFLDVTDMRLLSQNIPAKGVRNIVLIGSLFDSVLLDVFEDYDSIGDALRSLTSQKQREAQANFDKVKNEISKKALKDALASALPPIFISSMCYNIAKHYDNLNAEERNILENLNSMYDDFKFDADKLLSLANFEEVNSKFEEVKGDKDTILSEKFSNSLEGFEDGFSYQIDLIKKSIIQKKEQLTEADLDKLSNKQKLITKRLESSNSKINSVFERHIIEAEKNFTDLILEIEESANLAKRINSQSGTETHSYEVSTSKWYNPFSWGSSKTVYETVTYSYANVHEAVGQLEDYVFSSKRVLIRAIKEIVNIKKFRADVFEKIEGLFDFNDDDFDIDDVLIPVENAVNRITIPNVDIDVDKHIDNVRNQFDSNQVRNDEINSLRNEQARVVKLITNDIKAEMNTTLNKISLRLKNIRDEFIPNLTNDLQKNLEDITEQIKNREEYLKRYNELFRLLDSVF